MLKPIGCYLIVGGASEGGTAKRRLPKEFIACHSSDFVQALTTRINQKQPAIVWLPIPTKVDTGFYKTFFDNL